MTFRCTRLAVPVSGQADAAERAPAREGGATKRQAPAGASPALQQQQQQQMKEEEEEAVANLPPSQEEGGADGGEGAGAIAAAAAAGGEQEHEPGSLLLDPTDEFVWTENTCQKVYDEFQDLVDHYEGAPLSEYTLRLIGSDLGHYYIRKLLYDGEIKYNMMSRVLNFSMGKPRVKFNSSQIPDVK
ncbi:hypothetical protein ABZP36_008205 [Zizania latifolia]